MTICEMYFLIGFAVGSLVSILGVLIGRASTERKRNYK